MNSLKETYKAPEIKVLEFACKDIVMESPNLTPEDYQ